MNNSVRVKVEPTVSEDVKNSTTLRNLMKSELRSKQDEKPEIAKHQSRESQ